MAVSATNGDLTGNDSGHGFVRIYQYQSGIWTQLGQDINGEAAHDRSGIINLSSDGTIIAIGAPRNDGNGEDSGHVRVYQYQTDTWVQVGQDIDGEAPGEYLSSSILSSDGSILATTARYGENIGQVRVYQYEGGTWTQLGQDINGEAPGDLSGATSLSSDGTIISIGSRYNDGNGESSGHVRVYQYQSGTWIQIGQDIDGEVVGDESGVSTLSSDGTIIAIGGPKNDGNGYNSGHVRVLEYQSGTWVQIGQDINGKSQNDYFGYNISLSGDGTVLAVNAPEGEFEAGYTRVYKYESENWIRFWGDITGDISNFQSSINLSKNGENLAIGFWFSGINWSGEVKVYDLSSPFLTLSLNEFQNSTFKLYPNPTKNQFTIQLDNTSTLEQVSIYTILGQKILTSNEMVVDTSKLASGSYIVEITTNTGKTSKKLIVE